MSGYLECEGCGRNECRCYPIPRTGGYVSRETARALYEEQERKKAQPPISTTPTPAARDDAARRHAEEFHRQWLARPPAEPAVPPPPAPPPRLDPVHGGYREPGAVARPVSAPPPPPAEELRRAVLPAPRAYLTLSIWLALAGGLIAVAALAARHG